MQTSSHGTPEPPPTVPFKDSNQVSTQTLQQQQQLSTELAFDPTLSFFAKPHTISVLVVMLALFLYVALYVTEESDSLRNTKM